MPLHAYCRCWLHIVWATLERRPLLAPPAAAKVSAYLTSYATEKGIYMRINHVNADHVHVLIDLPVTKPIGWQRGYGAFSVSHSGVEEAGAYIANQQEHHRKRNFDEELKLLVEKYGLQWHKEENR